MQNKIRVAVFFGGRSNEKETSLDSGRNVVYKLDSQKYEVSPVFVNKDFNLYKINQRLLVQNSTKEIEESLANSVQIGEAQLVKWDELTSNFDFVFLGLHGGEGENGTIQGALEMLEISYNGSGIFSSGLCADKYRTSTYLKSRGFDILNFKLISNADWLLNKNEIIQSIEAEIGYPLITKPKDDGCSVLVYKSCNQDEFIKNVENTLKEKTEVLIEQFAPGMELTVGCIGNDVVKALVPTQTVSTHSVLTIEEKFLPGAGLNITPAELPEEDIQHVRKTIESIYKELKCAGYARIDCFYDITTKKLFVIDVNTLPGLTPATCIFHQAAELDISPSEFLDIIVQLGLENHGKGMHLSDNFKTELFDDIIQK